MSPATPGGDDGVLAVGINVTAVPEKPAGAGQYIIELVRALARREDIALTSFSRGDDTVRWHHLAPSSRHRVVGIAPAPRPLRVAFEELVLGSVARHRQPVIDVFHGPHYALPIVRPAPMVATVHDLTLVEHPEWHEAAKVAFFSRALRRVAAHADGIIFLSAHDAARFATRYSPRGALHVVPHGVDHQRFRPAEGESGADLATLARLGIRAPFVVHVGTIEPRKNLPLLVSAFEHLATSRPGLTLVLAGGRGWGGPDLDRALAASSAKSRIQLTGYVADADVPALLRGAAAVAYPSTEEGFGLPVLEALACGAPTVTTADSVMSEIAGSSALLVPAGDVDGLTQALEAAMADDAAAALRRTSGLLRAAEFTWAKSAAGHVGAYRAAISGQAAVA